MGIAGAAYARMLRALLPKGRAWEFRPSDLVQRLLLAASDELARIDERAVVLLRETDPRNADELLPDHERIFELTATGTIAERVARVVSLYIRRQRFRPVDFQEALAPLFGLTAAQVIVVEISHAAALLMDDAREIYRFFVWRDPSLPGSYDLPGGQAMIDRMKPSHTLGFAIESVDFLCDDPFSLCDRDILGV